MADEFAETPQAENFLNQIPPSQGSGFNGGSWTVAARSSAVARTIADSSV
jgi:hypothetical protein